jgi:hypothetical protein
MRALSAADATNTQDATSIVSRWSVAIATALASMGIGMAVLLSTQPEEDAFILFRYVNNLVAGHGVVFNPGDVHAEGATDFLWMLLLGGLAALGLDAAVGAVVLNAVGAGLATAILFRVVAASPATRLARSAWFILLPIVVLSSSGASAGYGGFSSMLYAAGALLAIHLGLELPVTKLLWLPPLALALGLFRPDGVLLGAGVAAIGGVRAWRSSSVRPYLLSLGAVTLVGAGYFVWRLHYFGLALPLPLYVKARAGEPEKLAQLPALLQWPFARLPGLGANLHWFTAGGALAAIAVAAVSSLLLLRRERSLGPWPARLLPALPCLALWAGLCLAYQIQNVDWRFQAPLHLAALYFAFRGVRAITTRRIVAPAVGTALLAVAMAGSIWVGWIRAVRQLHPERGGYLDTFAARLGEALPPGTRIALTEAGRLPFWTEAQVMDTIGLNTPETAVRPVSLEVLERFHPHIVFFHHAHMMDFSAVGRGDRIRALPIPTAMVRARYRPALAREDGGAGEPGLSAVRLAALVMTRYLEAHRAEFDVFAVDPQEWGEYGHIYAFRKGMATQAALTMLREALRPNSQVSYLALRRQQRAHRERAVASRQLFLGSASPARR